MTNPTPRAPFPGNLENKSAEPLADEAKALTVADDSEDDTPAEQTVKVTLLHHYKDHIPGDELDLDPRTASTLVAGRYADLG